MFANMDYQDRQAFFELMNLWADSRPDLFPPGGRAASPGTNGNGAASIAASHAQSFAAKNPAMTSSLISSGIQHQAAANPQSKWSSALQNDKVSSALGRVGAAGLASGAAKPPSPGPPPPPSAASKGKTAVSGLVSSRGFGHVDTSSKLGALKTVFKDPQAPAAPYVPPPQAAAPVSSGSASRRGIPPPPVRRVTPVVAAAEPEAEPEEQGDYAEAMYEFASDDPGDLPLKAKQVVLIVEKVSADWWKCRDSSTGREGLVPSAYVKEL